MAEKVFTGRGLAKAYTSGEVQVLALQGVDLDVWAGEMIVLLGPSGSGKSTLLNIMGGLDHATSGTLHFKDLELTALDDSGLTAYRRRHVGFVFQFYNLIPSLTARENVAVPLLLCGESRRTQHTRALELLDRVGLADRARHRPGQLSVGQQQRVALARTLANDPCVILADEPTGNLDPETRDSVLAFFDNFHRAGKTIVMVTHDPQAARRATRTLTLGDGGISDAAPVSLRCSA